MMIKKRRERERIKSAIKKVEKQEWRHINGEKKKGDKRENNGETGLEVKEKN